MDQIEIVGARLHNLKNITAGLGSLNRMFVFVFDFYEKLMNVLKLD